MRRPPGKPGPPPFLVLSCRLWPFGGPFPRQDSVRSSSHATTPRISVLLLAIALAADLFSPPAGAQVYNLHLLTDSVPDFTDLPSLVESSTAAWPTPQEKCIAVWRWGRRCRRQTSCAVEGGRHIWDPILHYNSYGAMNCGIISS